MKEGIKSKMLTLVSNKDDWEGLYVDGILWAEDHSISSETLLKALGIEIEHITVDADWLYERGNLPNNLEEISDFIKK